MIQIIIPLTMNIVRYLSIILYFMICFEGKSGQSSGSQSNINALYPCNVTGDTRLFVDSNNTHYPQVCTYINISAVETNHTSTSGLYFISFCYDDGWSGSHNSEAFCLITGYLDYVGMPSGLTISNEYLPKYSNLVCSGSETDIQMCGGNVTTAQCNIVNNMYCVRCVSHTGCLGSSNSLCNYQGICECKECVNGICFVGGCLCDDGYRGDECVESICNPPCGNGGVCQSGAICSCSFPYAGASCETNITCSPACSPGSECIVDMTQQAVYCCPGEESSSMCQTTQSTATTVTLLNTTIQLVSTKSTKNTVIFNSGFDQYFTIMISIVIPLLCCLVIILYLVIICVCVFSMVFMTMMKHKMNKTLKSKYHNGSFPPLSDERRPTVYTEINEKTMLDYRKAPDLHPTRMEHEYIEMGSVGMPPVKKASHYEIEDVMEANVSSYIGEKRKEPLNIPESASPIFNAVYSPSRQLIVNDKTNAAQDNESAYENPNSNL